MSGDIFGYHTGEEGAIGIYWVEVRGAAKNILQCTGQLITTKHYPAQIINNAEGEMSCTKNLYYFLILPLV